MNPDNLKSLVLPVIISACYFLVPLIVKKLLKSQNQLRKKNKAIIPKWAKDKSFILKLDVFKGLEILLTLILWVGFVILISSPILQGPNKILKLADVPFFVVWFVLMVTTLAPSWVVSQFFLGMIFKLMNWKVDTKLFFNYTFRMYDKDYVYSIYKVKDPLHALGSLEKYIYWAFFISLVLWGVFLVFLI